MESIIHTMDCKIKTFLFAGSGYGDGSGCGYGDGSGYGYGSGYGRGSGSGYGDGSGSGYGCGSGCGSGYGDGSGYGYGCGSGYGYGSGRGSGCGSGYGDGYDIKAYNGRPVYIIDGVLTLLTHTHGNLAKGFILNRDLTLSPCYVVKHENLFAHGETREEAQQALNDKLFEDMPEGERIDAFLEEFQLGTKYPASKFYDWHNKLTGSCKMGRDTFVRNHGIGLDSDMFTVEEFVALCENDYGGDVVKALKERIADEKT